MAPLIASAAGAAYGLGLWSIAVLVARRRSIGIGILPVWLPMACAAAAAALDAAFAPDIALPASASLIGALVCGLVDARTGLIFDALSLTIAVAAGALAVVEHHFAGGVLAAAIVGGMLAALYLMTNRRGIGLGDVKLGAALALGYGIESGIAAIGSAFVLGAFYAVILIARGRAKRTDALRFGPFIAGGAVVGMAARGLGWSW